MSAKELIASLFHDRRSLFAGLAIGFVVALLLLSLVSSRYKVTTTSEVTFKIDTWTGSTWVAQHYYKEKVGYIWFWVTMPDR